jgi:hypothetical protein
VIDVIDYQPEQLDSERRWRESEIEFHQRKLDAVNEEINRRTSPWPWPRSVQPFLLPQIWADEILVMCREPFIIGSPSDRARPNSGE